MFYATLNSRNSPMGMQRKSNYAIIRPDKFEIQEKKMQGSVIHI
jgi:hypothetical protein